MIDTFVADYMKKKLVTEAYLIDYNFSYEQLYKIANYNKKEEAKK